MAKPMTRVAAGAAAVFAIAVVGGAGAAVSAANPGSSRSPSVHSRDDGRPHRHGDGNQSRRSPHDGDRRDHGDRRGGGGSGDSRHPDRPHRGSVSARGVAGQPTEVTAGRTSSTITGTDTLARGVVVESSAPSVTAVAPTIPLLDIDAGSGGGVSAADGSVAPDVVPRVVFGDGRSPIVVTEPRPVEVVPTIAPKPLIAPSAPPPVPSTTAPPSAMTSTPWPQSGTQVAALWGTARPGWPTGALFGVTGLLLAPVAGVWLGHRQARGARDAARLVNR